MLLDTCNGRRDRPKYSRKSNGDDHAMEDQEDSKIIQDLVPNNGPIQENSDFDFNLYAKEIKLDNRRRKPTCK